ncbi:hypothetical protein IBA8403_24070 [Pseudomonas syringae]
MKWHFIMVGFEYRVEVAARSHTKRDANKNKVRIHDPQDFADGPRPSTQRDELCE